MMQLPVQREHLRMVQVKLPLISRAKHCTLRMVQPEWLGMMQLLVQRKQLGMVQVKLP
jgi:hypothetical protein